MSKLTRKPVKVPDDFVDAEPPKPLEVDEELPGVPSFADTASAEQPLEITREVAKVAVNDLTPRCAFCRSVRIEKMPTVNFLLWRCNDCRKHFRAPITGEAA